MQETSPNKEDDEDLQSKNLLLSRILGLKLWDKEFILLFQIGDDLLNLIESRREHRYLGCF